MAKLSRFLEGRYNKKGALPSQISAGLAPHLFCVGPGAELALGGATS